MITIGAAQLDAYRRHLAERERSTATAAKYLRVLERLAAWSGGELRERSQLVAFKSRLQRDFAPATVNAMLAAVNGYLRWAGAPEWTLGFLRIQRRDFSREERELTRREYEKLVATAERSADRRLSLLVQTVCATGIRVSELASITVAAARQGRAEVRSKGKIRLILLPKRLCAALLGWCKARGIRRGPVFVTSTGHPLDRSNIWRMMKALAARAGVSPAKVFPHNLRHLFARTYYKMYRDIVRLADILGHSSVETTRIYTAHSYREQRRQMDAMPLLL